MGGLSLWHILLVAAVAFLLFGGPGKISSAMGDFGKGLRKFKEGLKADSPDDSERLEAAPRNEDIPSKPRV
jgi:sec-independent protein translocase protein TatA